MTLRSQAHALIGSFLADIDAIIRSHAERAAALALAERGLAGGRRAKRLGRAAPLKLVPPEPAPSPKGRQKQARAKAAAPAKRPGKKKRGRTPRAEQLTLF